MTLPGGALGGFGTVDYAGASFPALVDTGTAITAYDSQPGAMRDATAHRGAFQLYDAGGTQRVNIYNITLFDTPLRSVGLNGAATPVGGVLGGDNISLFAASFDYRNGPQMTLTEIISTCSCQLADDCNALMNFTLEGGQQIIQLGADLYNYPASRVVIDACLEPIEDPLQTPPASAPDDPSRAGTCCTGHDADPARADDLSPCVGGSTPGMLPNPPYRSSGVDVKLLVATGFPGMAIGAAAYDRLRGMGAAAQALAASSDRLHLPDPDDDGPNGEGLPVAQVQLGGGTVTIAEPDNRDPNNPTTITNTYTLSALAMVGRELYFGPCNELARSRRQRRVPPSGAIIRATEAACLQRPGQSQLPEIQGCVMQESNTALCDDANTQNAVAAYVEVVKPLPAYVMADTAPILAGINADVRPTNATVEGIIGTALLQRLTTTIDYPNGRLIVRCADDQCLTYPRLIKLNECGRDCTDSSNLDTPPDPNAVPPFPGGLEYTGHIGGECGP